MPWMPYFKDARVPRIAVLLCCAALCGGCNWLKPLAFMLPEPTRKVPAEFAHLEGSVAVVSWAPPETLYEYPNARLEVAAHVAGHLQSQDSDLAIVDFAEVEAFINERGIHAIDPQEVARHFQARYVVYLELLEFTFREPQMPEFLQGRIHASVVVYDFSDPELPPQTYDLEPVIVRVPDHPMRFSQSNALVVRKATYETFGGRVAMKFRDHEEVVK